MLTWVFFVALAIFAIFMGLLPLLRNSETVDGVETFNTSVFKDQLAEVDADLERGVINEQDAEAARAEISRKLIAASEQAEQKLSSTEKSASFTLFKDQPKLRMALAGLPVLFLSLGVYSYIGEPGRTDLPLEARNQKTPEQKRIAELIGKVEERLRAHPDDKKGWEVLAPVLLREQEYDKAAHAFRQAIRLNGENVKRLTGLGEAIVFQNNGMVPLEAERAFRKALAMDPLVVMPRIRLATAKEQKRDFKGASEAYQKILDLSGKGAPWIPAIKQRLAAVKSQLGSKQQQTTSRGSSDGQIALQNQSAIPPASPGPSAEDIKAAQNMSAGDRSAMINQMVARLAGKLKENGDDLNGWLKLMRAYKVLGKTSEASNALKQAQTYFKEKPKALAALAQAAKSMGIGS